MTTCAHCCRSTRRSTNENGLPRKIAHDLEHPEQDDDERVAAHQPQLIVIVRVDHLRSPRRRCLGVLAGRTGAAGQLDLIDRQARQETLHLAQKVWWDCTQTLGTRRGQPERVGGRRARRCAPAQEQRADGRRPEQVELHVLSPVEVVGQQRPAPWCARPGWRRRSARRSAPRGRRTYRTSDRRSPTSQRRMPPRPPGRPRLP